METKKKTILTSLTKEYLISGYIREFETISKTLIPKEINAICLMYYQFEQWDADCIHEDYEINENILIKKKSSMTTAFLSNIMDKGKHHWRFQIETPDGEAIDIGIFKEECDSKRCIDSYPGKQANEAYMFSTSGHVNTYNEANAWYKQYGKKCKSGDIIDMVLDFDDLSLSFSINDKSYGKAHENIEITQYRAAVYLYTANHKIELLRC